MKTFKELINESKDAPFNAEELTGYKKTYVRTSGQSTPDSQSMQKSFGGTIYGFLATKSNMAAGYIVSSVTKTEQKEFGQNVVRVSSEKTFTTTIAKIDTKKGKITFIDNEAYENGEVKWLSPMAYNRLILDKEEYIKVI